MLQPKYEIAITEMYQGLTLLITVPLFSPMIHGSKYVIFPIYTA